MFFFVCIIFVVNLVKHETLTKLFLISRNYFTEFRENFVKMYGFNFAKFREISRSFAKLKIISSKFRVSRNFKMAVSWPPYLLHCKHASFFEVSLHFSLSPNFTFPLFGFTFSFHSPSFSAHSFLLFLSTPLLHISFLILPT